MTDFNLRTLAGNTVRNVRIAGGSSVFHFSPFSLCPAVLALVNTKRGRDFGFEVGYVHKRMWSVDDVCVQFEPKMEWVDKFEVELSSLQLRSSVLPWFLAWRRMDLDTATVVGNRSDTDVFKATLHSL
jgi:hypothetical protein